MATTRNLNKKYRALSSMKQLRAERRKLEYLIDVKEVEIRHDYYRLRDSLSIENLFGMAAGRLGLGSVVSSISSGFSFVLKSIDKLRARFCNCRC